MMRTTIVHIPALDCPDELALVQRSLRRVRGINELAPDYLARNLRVLHDPAQVDAAAILKAIQGAWFSAQVALPTSQRSAPVATRVLNRYAVQPTTLLGGMLLASAALFRFITGHSAWFIAFLTVASALVSGIPVAIAAIRALRLRTL